MPPPQARDKMVIDLHKFDNDDPGHKHFSLQNIEARKYFVAWVIIIM